MYWVVVVVVVMSMSHGATTAAAVHQLPKCYSIAVFCGSKSGASPSYASAARALVALPAESFATSCAQTSRVELEAQPLPSWHDIWF